MTEEEIIQEYEAYLFENDAPPMTTTEKICVQTFLSSAIAAGVIEVSDE